MDPSCLVSMVQAGGVMVWGIFSWHTLGPLVPIGHHLNATAYLSIVADHVHPFMTTVSPSSDGSFQQDRQSSNHLTTGFFTMTMRSLSSNGLHTHQISSNRAPLGCGGEIGIVDVQPTNLQQLRDVIMSLWRKISEECFQHLFVSIPPIMKAKGDPTRY